MKETEVKQRVLQNSKLLALSKFSWDEKTQTFSSVKNNSILDSTDISNCTFNTGHILKNKY